MPKRNPILWPAVGDVNSTIAAAFAATRLGLKVAQIQAGLRSFDNSMPEEINRKLTDAIADLLFVTEESGVRNLRNEGVPAERIFFVGNLMIDTLLRHRAMASQSRVLEELHLMNGNGARPYGVLTLHRPSNVDSAESLKPLLKAISEIAKSLPILVSIHPRTAKRIQNFGLQGYLREAGDGDMRIGSDLHSSARLFGFSAATGSGPAGSDRFRRDSGRDHGSGRALSDSAPAKIQSVPRRSKRARTNSLEPIQRESPQPPETLWPRTEAGAKECLRCGTARLRNASPRFCSAAVPP